jgi:hypothetical protein
LKVMESFPKCLTLQLNVCSALRNLTDYYIGKKKAREAGQTIDLLLAAVNNHLDSAFLCEYAIFALYGVITTNDNKVTKLILGVRRRRRCDQSQRAVAQHGYTSTRLLYAHVSYLSTVMPFLQITSKGRRYPVATV